MDERLLSFTAEIIRQTSREKPADGVLRAELKRSDALSQDNRRDVSRAMFAYYRWRGWLTGKMPMEQRIKTALEFATRFAKNPFSISTESLVSKALPEWVADEVQCSPQWLRALQREPALWLRARPGCAKKLANKLGRCKASRLPLLRDAVLFDGQADLFRTAEFEAGEFELQDIASQAVGVLCAPQPGETWWDACAGEGGKMLHLGDLMQNKGLVWASDRAEWRLDKLKTRAARAQLFNYRTVLWDGGAHLPTQTKFDGVLVDAPCSGLGTWQRNPHARWTTTPEDVRELAAVQSRLLQHCAVLVKPGGRLIYAVCTLTRSETTAVCDVFSVQHPDFEPMPLVNPFNEFFPPTPQLWLWPQETGGNGMFIAAWKRRS
ncbi:MAG: RsmB/NOP family class I SAM-dependent RNA methyltransferase [Verrucomicrobia bacterium]|nr:RsmB/NOP family class I SAM-dependent RNA methyltransferase [Verrucomicrobiota bacterium]